MRTTTMATTAALVLVLVTSQAGAGLDCARVKQMKQQGASAVEIARELGLTTPDVQACLADAVEPPQMANPAGKLPLAPQRPAVGDGPIRRAPAGMNE